MGSDGALGYRPEESVAAGNGIYAERDGAEVPDQERDSGRGDREDSPVHQRRRYQVRQQRLHTDA